MNDFLLLPFTKHSGTNQYKLNHLYIIYILNPFQAMNQIFCSETLALKIFGT